jgi:hypothetical protein
MSCCGQKRDGAENTERPAMRTVPPQVPIRQASPAPAAGSTVTLRLRDRSPIVLHSQSGRRYQFHGAGSMQAVDRRDAESLLASGLFERVWG